MTNHPALAEALTGERTVELRRSAQANPYRRRPTRRLRVGETARRGAGWLLVDIGLRLALPRRAMHGPAPRGER
jgi:hypothetical protein